MLSNGRLSRAAAALLLLIFLPALNACVRPAPGVQPWKTLHGENYDLPSGTQDHPSATIELPSATPYRFPTRDPSIPYHTPTPDAPRSLPSPRTAPLKYAIRSGDTLTRIALWYDLPVSVLIKENNLTNPDVLEVGDEITIPAPHITGSGPGLKIIPDSELVAGPSSSALDISGFIDAAGGYLRLYQENIGDSDWSAAEIIERIAREYSVNPRLLLAIIEYQSGWVTKPDLPDEKTLSYPVGYRQAGYAGLYRQLAWSSNQLNRGYYGWLDNSIAGWYLADDAYLLPNPTINAGTAGVQTLFTSLKNQRDWEYTLSDEGLLRTYENLFGISFDYAIEPLLPPGLQQPPLLLPFEEGAVWSFTGGPHGGWGSYSAWAAIDFAPPGTEVGCFKSDEWVTASAPGKILYSDEGLVLQDLDGDDDLQTGWTLMYMHIASNGRIPAERTVEAGDHIGHPSCEGGVSNGTHVHIARRYNGMWIAAAGTIPLDLGGWITSGDGYEYNGWLSRGGISVEAWNGRRDENQISH